MAIINRAFNMKIINLFIKNIYYIKQVNINRKLHISFKMKKFILFPSYLLIISLLSIGCYNNPEQTTSSAMIILKNVHEKDVEHDCKDCHKQIYTIIKSVRGIHDIDITQSEDKSTILILIEYNHKIGNLSEIKRNLVSKGYELDLN